MQQVEENEQSRKKVCKTANDWPRKERKPQEVDDDLASAGVLFVVSSYVWNSDNARIVALSLASIFVHHPLSDVLIVDQQSPVEGTKAMHALLSDWELKKKQTAAQSGGGGMSQMWGSVSMVRPPWPSACRKIPCAFPDDLSFSGENASAHQEPYYLPPPSGKEIGALQEAFRFVESRGKLETNPAPHPPSMVVLLQHSTGTLLISSHETQIGKFGKQQKSCHNTRLNPSDSSGSLSTLFLPFSQIGLHARLPLEDIKSLYDAKTCRTFALDVPWYRVEDKSNRFWSSRYGTNPGIEVRFFSGVCKRPGKGFAG